MKKSTRILAILMAFVMLIGSFSVMGSAYQAYKGDTIASQYNDVDAVDFTPEQYASMGLDELDRILAKEKILLDIYIGKLDLSSVNTTLTSVHSLVSSVQSLLPLLGDAANLPDYVKPLEGIQRFEDTDLDVIYALLNFIANIAPLGQKFVEGKLDLGIMQSFIGSFIFDVRNLAIGLIYGMTKEGKAADFDAMNDADKLPDKYKNTKNGALTLLQDLLNELVLGEWKQLDDEFNDPYSYVMYESYGFMSEYGETKYDTVKYDYYGWVHPNHWVTTGLGGYKRVTAGATAPAPIYDVIDITGNRTGYEFIETLMQTAYNQILIPVLNRDTRVALRELCGVTYDEKYTKRTIYNETTGEWVINPDYNPSYDGDESTVDPSNPYLKLLNLDAKAVTVEIPAGETFVDNFNDILGEFLDNIAAVPRNTPNADGYDWTWTDGGNEYLFDNICSAGKFILQVSGDLFFSEYVTVPSAEEIEGMSNQQLVAFLMRAILNSSVDWMYIEDEYQTVAEVGYRAVEQLAWQDIPQFTYTKPDASKYGTIEEYYDALVDKAITILFDVAVYNLNQGFDMVPANGNDPVNAEGLLQYSGDEGHYSDILIQVAAWGISEYGALLNLDFFCDDYNGEVGDLTIDNVWQDIDTIINSLIPIKGSKAWISSTIAGDGTQIVSRPLIFDYLIKPICYLDSTDLAEIFARNTTGQFATDNGVKIIMSFLTNVFELLFPGVFQAKSTIDEVLNNQLLGAMVGDLLKALGTNNTTNALGKELKAQGKDIVAVALPIVCMILGLSDDQEFEEMEIYLPETISSTAANPTAPTFEIFNGSSGINTAYTDKNGNVTQDKLYTYTLNDIFVYTYGADGNDTNALTASVENNATTIAGGDSVKVTLNGTRTAGNLVEVQVYYTVYAESGAELTKSQLSKSVYAYIGESNLDDDATVSTINIDASKDFAIEYNPSIYLETGDGLDDIESYSIRIQDLNDDGKTTGSAKITAVSNAAAPFATLNPERVEVEANKKDENGNTVYGLEGKGGLYFLNPFVVATKADGTLYERYEETYEVDENGELVLDTNGDPIPVSNNGGVINGQYNVTTTVTVNGNNYSVPTYIHLYDDYDLVSIFERAVAANRQQSNYSGDFEGAWNNYVAALKDAARLALKPKTGASFLADITVDKSTGYENKYEMYADRLSIAIEALDAFEANAGTTGLKNALADYSGANYKIEYDSNNRPYRVDLEYDDDAYVYFGMRDYVPHTYNKYKDARNRVEDLINSQQFFVPAPFEAGYEPTAEEQAAYDEAVAAYLKNVEEMGAISSIESTYAIHMLELTGERLIRVSGSTDKLDMLLEKYGNAKNPEFTYTADSEERYDRAVAFAAEVLDESDPRPSKINQATSELVEAWKKLATLASYTKLETAKSSAQAIVDVVGTDAAKQKVYTTDSYQAFLDLYNEAVAVIEAKDLSDTTDNQNYLDGLADDLDAARLALAPATSSEAVIEFVTEDPGVFADSQWFDTFIPRITTGALTHEYYNEPLPDGTPVDGYIVGMGEGMDSEELVLQAFGTLENVDAVVTPYVDGLYGTGTVIQFFNSSSGDLEKTYIVVVIGDTNGDAAVDTLDETAIFDHLNGLDLEWGGNYTAHFAVAGDITNDAGVDALDADYYYDVTNYFGYINQEVGEFGEASFVAVE